MIPSGKMYYFCDEASGTRKTVISFHAIGSFRKASDSPYVQHVVTSDKDLSQCSIRFTILNLLGIRQLYDQSSPCILTLTVIMQLPNQLAWRFMNPSVEIK
jgi:hypothetical protein